MIRTEHARVICWLSALLGTLAYALLFRSWRDAAHLVYDLSAVPVVCAFGARAMIDLVNRPEGTAWRARGALVAPLIFVPAGAEYLGFNASGHLTAMLLAIAGTLMARNRPAALIVAGFAALVPVGFIRWFLFDDATHMRTYNALAIVAASLVAAWLVERYAARER